MYYWKTDQLATEIKENTLSETQKKNYYLATSILGTAFMYLAIAGGSNDIAATMVECLLILLIVVAAINITFKTNGGNEGVDYIPRVLMLGFPVLIKMFALSMLIGVVLGIVEVAFDIPDLLESQWVMTGIATVVQVFYYWSINVHLRVINE